MKNAYAIIEGTTTATVNHMRTIKVDNGKVTYIHAEPNESNISRLQDIIDNIRKGSLVEIAQIPAKLMSFDTRYQIPDRVNRSKAKLIANFDIRKMAPLIGVVHEEEGYVAILDGVGRLTATQTIDPKKYARLPVMLLMDAPKDPHDRLVFEAEYYEFQDDNNAKVTPIQKHGARLVRGDKAAVLLESLKDEYGFHLAGSTREAGCKECVPYSEFYSIAKAHGEPCCRYIMDVLKGSRMLFKAWGRSVYVLRSLRDAYNWYQENATETKPFLIKVLRPMDPQFFRAEAMTKYPMLEYRAACSLYLEDLIVENLGLQQKHMVNEKGKVIEIPVAV